MNQKHIKIRVQLQTINGMINCIHMKHWNDFSDEDKQLALLHEPAYYRHVIARSGVHDQDVWDCGCCGKTDLDRRESIVDTDHRGLVVGMVCHRCCMLLKRYRRNKLTIETKVHWLESTFDSLRERAERMLNEVLPERRAHAQRLRLLSRYLDMQAEILKRESNVPDMVLEPVTDEENEQINQRIKEQQSR